MKKITHTKLALILMIVLVKMMPLQVQAQQPELVADFNTTTIRTDPRNMTTIDGKIYFTAQDSDGKYKLYIYDGTDTEIVKFRDRYLSGSPSGFIKGHL